MTSPTSLSNKSITAHLLALQTRTPYAAATQHPFLTAAGRLALPRARLALWLSQDKIYAASAYPRFVALLIAKIPFGAGGIEDTTPVSQEDGSPISLSLSLSESRNRRTLRCLVGALQNSVRAVGFFEDTAARWGLEIGGMGDVEGGWVERWGTREYTAEMARVASLGTLEEGLVFLWAMERVYLDAWRYVKSLLPPVSEAESSAHPVSVSVSVSVPSQAVSDSTGDGDRLDAMRQRRAGWAIREFIERWTNDEFVAFVDELATLADEHYGAVDADGGSLRGKSVARAEEIWARVIELEEAFWPNAGEEVTARVSKS